MLQDLVKLASFLKSQSKEIETTQLRRLIFKTAMDVPIQVELFAKSAMALLLKNVMDTETILDVYFDRIYLQQNQHFKNVVNDLRLEEVSPNFANIDDLSIEDLKALVHNIPTHREWNSIMEFIKKEIRYELPIEEMLTEFVFPEFERSIKKFKNKQKDNPELTFEEVLDVQTFKLYHNEDFMDLFLAWKIGAEENDWRPTEVIPEDYYAF